MPRIADHDVGLVLVLEGPGRAVPVVATLLGEGHRAAHPRDVPLVELEEHVLEDVGERRVVVGVPEAVHRAALAAPGDRGEHEAGEQQRGPERRHDPQAASPEVADDAGATPAAGDQEPAEEEEAGDRDAPEGLLVADLDAQVLLVVEPGDGPGVGEDHEEGHQPPEEADAVGAGAERRRDPVVAAQERGDHRRAAVDVEGPAGDDPSSPAGAPRGPLLLALEAQLFPARRVVDAGPEGLALELLELGDPVELLAGVGRERGADPDGAVLEELVVDRGELGVHHLADVVAGAEDGVGHQPLEHVREGAVAVAGLVGEVVVDVAGPR